MREQEQRYNREPVLADSRFETSTRECGICKIDRLAYLGFPVAVLQKLEVVRQDLSSTSIRCGYFIMEASKIPCTFYFHSACLNNLLNLQNPGRFAQLAKRLSIGERQRYVKGGLHPFYEVVNVRWFVGDNADLVVNFGREIDILLG